MTSNESEDSLSRKSPIIESNEDDSLLSSKYILPDEIHSAIQFFCGQSSQIPDDEKSLFFLRSLLALGNTDETVFDCVTDKLSQYDSYYETDPYEKSSSNLHNIGIYECEKLFTEECFHDLQLVLEFSKLTQTENIYCRSDFELFMQSLKVIIETTAEDKTNSSLFQKFKYLYEKMNSK